MITQSELKSKLYYNPETGIFTRITTKKSNNKPSSNGYIYLSVNNKQYSAHRLAWLYVYGEFPTNCIDHINRIKHDNKIENLREASYSQNSYNKECKSKSGYKGVTWWERDKKWKAQIEIDGKNKHIGYFETPELAHKAYCTYQSQVAGEFARV